MNLNPAALQLVDALARYLSDTRDKNDVRRAINEWRHDASNDGAHPEHLLVEFKKLLACLKSTQLSVNLDERVDDRRELIAMCIEAFYASSSVYRSSR